MDLGIRGRVALVAASTGGLGRAVAEALADEGASVVVAGRRGELAQQIAATLPEAVAVQADLSAPGGPQALVEAAREAYGDPDSWSSTDRALGQAPLRTWTPATSPRPWTRSCWPNSGWWHWPCPRCGVEAGAASW